MTLKPILITFIIISFVLFAPTSRAAFPVDSKKEQQAQIPTIEKREVLRKNGNQTVIKPVVKAQPGKEEANFLERLTGAGGQIQLVGLFLAILTLGGGCIWALVDLNRIATGDLKPKNGEYDETF